MNQFNLSNFLNNFAKNYPMQNLNKGPNPQNPAPMEAGANPNLRLDAAENLMNQMNHIQQSVVQYKGVGTFSQAMIADLRMNNLANLERSLYVKDLMNMPREMEEVLVVLQQSTNLTTEETAKLLNTNVNISTLAELIQASGKDAMSKLVMVMAEASRQGISDTSQLKEAIKFINASVSVAAKDNPNMILKNFMLLYLPWLPLQEGVDFDLEIENSKNGGAEDELSITIMISTRNYGNIKATLVVLAGNSMSIIIQCCKEFPKEDLLKRLKEEDKRHSIQSDITFEQNAVKLNDEKSNTEESPTQAKISMSNLMEVNPFLLLMANAVIRHTIEIDNEKG